METGRGVISPPSELIRECLGIVREIAAMPGEGESPTDRHMIVCPFCDGGEYYDGVGIAFRHEPTCLHERACRLVARLEGE